MKPRCSLARLATLLIFALFVALFAGAWIEGPVYAGPLGLFNRCDTCNLAAPPQTAIAPQIPAGTAAASPAVSAERPCILPWNRPNGKCCPKEEVNVNVLAPAPKDLPPVNVAVEPAPEPRFPYGVLVAVLIPVVLIASVIAFMVRVGTSRV